MGGIGDVVRELRAERGWSQDDLVREARVSKATVQNIETGKFSPRQDTLRKVAGAFGKTPQDILTAAFREPHASSGDDPKPGSLSANRPTERKSVLEPFTDDDGGAEERSA